VTFLTTVKSTNRTRPLNTFARVLIKICQESFWGKIYIFSYVIVNYGRRIKK